MTHIYLSLFNQKKHKTNSAKADWNFVVVDNRCAPQLRGEKKKKKKLMFDLFFRTSACLFYFSDGAFF